MPKPKVFITRIIPDEGLNLINEVCDADVWQGDMPPRREELLQRVRGVDGLLALLTERIDDEVMGAAGAALKVISNFAVGFDNIDVNAATTRRIPIGNTPGVLTDATADMAFALMMSAARRVLEGDHYVRDGKWKTWHPKLLLGVEMKGATLGIVGFGRIGKAVARRALGFDMRVLYYDPTEKENLDGNSQKVDFETLLRESDFISLHTPLTPATRHLINAHAFTKMKQSAILINTARGAVVDHDALYDALKQNRIFAAALDVTDPEPLPADHKLLTLDNVIVVPHLGSASITARNKMASMAAMNLIAGVKGERLPNCVNPQVYESS